MERQYGGLAGRGSVPKEGLRRGQGGCGGDRCVYTRAVRFTRHPARMRNRTKATSIEGGTSEVMLNVIAKRILDLPGA